MPGVAIHVFGLRIKSTQCSSQVQNNAELVSVVFQHEMGMLLVIKSRAFITSLGTDTYDYRNSIDGNLKNLQSVTFLMSEIYIYSLLTRKMPLLSSCQLSAKEFSSFSELCWYSRLSVSLKGTKDAWYHVLPNQHWQRNRHMSGCVSSWNLTSVFLVKQISMCYLHHHLTSLTETVSPSINELLLYSRTRRKRFSSLSALQ